MWTKKKLNVDVMLEGWAYCGITEFRNPKPYPDPFITEFSKKVVPFI